MSEQDNSGRDINDPERRVQSADPPESSDWDAFSLPPAPSSDPPIDPDETPPNPEEKGKHTHSYLLLSILLLLLLIVFVAWVWVSDYFGIGIFGGGVSSPSSSSGAVESAVSDDNAGGWRPGADGSRPSSSGGAGDTSSDSEGEPGDSSDAVSDDDIIWVPGYPASRPDASSEIDTSGFDIVIAYPDGTTSPGGGPRPDGAASLPDIPVRPTDQEAVNQPDYEAPVNTPFAVRMDPSNFLNKSFFIDITYRYNASLYLEFVSDIADSSDRDFLLEPDQAAAVSADGASREYYNGIHYEYLTSNPSLGPEDPGFASMLNVSVFLYDLHSDTPDTPVVIDKEADGVTPLTLQYIIEQSRFDAGYPSEGLRLCELPALGDDDSSGVRSYRVRIQIMVNPEAGNEYQGAQLGGDFVYSLKITDGVLEQAETVARTAGGGGNANREGGSVQNLADSQTLLYIPAWNLSITLEMLINFVVATLLCFGFLVLIAKSRQMNEEFSGRNTAGRSPPQANPPRTGRPPERAAAAPARAGLKSGTGRQAEISRGRQIKSQMKSSLVFILILISLLVGFTVAAVTWKVQAPVIDNAILGTTIKPIIYAGSGYVANTGDSAVKIPIFDQEVLDIGGKPYLVKEFHILNTGTSEFQYRVYLSDFTNFGAPLDASSPLLEGITASIYLDEKDANERQNPVYSAAVSEFVRSVRPFTEADLDGSGVKQLVLPPMILGKNEQKNDQRYYMRLDFPESFAGMQLGFTVEVEAIQTSGSPGFEVLDNRPAG